MCNQRWNNFGGEKTKQVLHQLQDSSPDDSEVKARLAWILAVTADDSKKSRDLIDHAIRMQPENPAFRVIEGRVLLSAGRFQDALDTLSSINERYLSQAAITYRAAALLELDETEEAWRAVKEIGCGHLKDPMFAADERLLETIKNRLNKFTTSLRTQPAAQTSSVD